MGCAKRLPALDGLRGVAAIGVMLFHFNLFFLPQAKLFELVPVLSRAYLAVDLFFLLSGFVMAHVYGHALASDWRAHWMGFATARFARIYPLFALTTLAMIAVVAMSGTPPAQVSFSAGALLFQPFLLQQWLPDLSWNYPAWSISTEAEAYLFFVFAAGPLLTGRHPRLLAACCVAVLAELSIANHGSLELHLGFHALLRTLAEFSLGVFLYRVHAREPRQFRQWAALLALLLALFWGLAIETRHPRWAQDVLAVGALWCLIYYCVNAKGALARLMNSRPSVTLGNWSYSIYLLHAPTHYAVRAAFAASGHPVSGLGVPGARLLFLATTLLVVGLSAVLYQGFEIPVRRVLLHTDAASRAE